jgi:hypothetical protein
MKLARLAVLTFAELPKDHRGWTFQLGAVAIESRGAREKGGAVHVLASATVQLKRLPSVTRQRRVRIPPGPMRLCQRGLEATANLVSSSFFIRRSISSPTPCVALIPESEGELAWLSSRIGMHYPKVFAPTRFRPGFDLVPSLPILGERLDGVALLAEALAHTQVSGRFHEMMRLFELAFRASGKRLVDPLAGFLIPNRLEYSRQEIVHWIQEVRHGITHADEKDFFLLEGDVRPIIHRVDQAALDVLFNKGDWRSPDIGRRETWRPTSGLAGSTPFITAGVGGILEGTLLDDLGIFPRNLDSFLTSLPDGWWSPYPHDDQST